jgi:lipopolysaccharide export system protein LptC
MSVPPDAAIVDEVAPARRTLANVNRGYSRFVGLAKRTLPVVAVILLLIVAVWPKLQGEIVKLQINLPRLDPREAQDLRMVNARYTGLDRQSRPFVITAETARQNPSADQLVALEGPKGDLTSGSGSWFELTAFSGLYQPDTQLLDLFGNVQLFQDKGNEFHTDSAHVDMTRGNAEGDEPVEGQGPFGHVRGQGFRIRDRGDVIIFTGHARLDLQPHERVVE